MQNWMQSCINVQYVYPKCVATATMYRCESLLQASSPPDLHALTSCRDSTSGGLQRRLCRSCVRTAPLTSVVQDEGRLWLTTSQRTKADCILSSARVALGARPDVVQPLYGWQGHLSDQSDLKYASHKESPAFRCAAFCHGKLFFVALSRRAHVIPKFGMDVTPRMAACPVKHEQS